MNVDSLLIVYKGRLGKRRCYRVFHRDLKLVITIHGNKIKKLFRIKDLSTYGISFFAEESKYKFKIGEEISISIIFKRKFVLKNIKSRIIRLQNPNVVCCEFLDLNRKKEYILDELSVSIQKELINKAKNKKEKE